MSGAAAFPAATCWFCDRAPGTPASIALPFLSLPDEQEVRVIVLPRCDACRTVHANETHPYLIVVPCVLGLTIASLFLPVSEAALTYVAVAAMLAGAVIGLLVVAMREQQRARRHRLKPLSAMVQHPLYQQWGRDTARWRLRTGPRNPMKHRTHVRWVSVSDHRQAYANDPIAMAALEQGCREANVPAT